MISYKPIKLDFQEIKDPLIMTMAAIGVGSNAVQNKKMAFCGGKNAFGDFCRQPVYYSNDSSLRDVVCGMCGSEINWEDFITYVNYCPECKEERDSIHLFCTHHTPAVKLEKRVKSQ
jgi:hypothetical protein